MIYLILDTNIWLYMANGWDSLSNKIHTGSERHMEVFEEIKSKAESGEFEILVNEIILNEWTRNRSKAQLHIRELEKEQRSRINEIVKAKNELVKEDFKQKCANIYSVYEKKVERNKKHILAVEDFINSCREIKISNEVKMEVVELAFRQERAPFLNKKNNCADAAILLSSIDFLKKNINEHFEKAVFVSNNYKEFGDLENENRFHPDLQERMGNLSLDFHRHFLNLLDITEDLQQEIDIFYELIWEKSNYFMCLSPQCEPNEDHKSFGFLDEKIRIVESKENIDPAQLELFEKKEFLNFNMSQFVSKGNCVVCNTYHIECPGCNSILIDVNENGQFYCNHCQFSYEVDTCPRYGDSTIYSIKEEELFM